MSTEIPAAASAAPAAKPEKQANKYKATLALPNTAFAMKANLVVNEAASMKRWEAMDLYGKLRSARAGAEPFVFHDGPPYANGNIHLGHLLNKVLKDLVVRSQNMLGKDCAFTPGWDCHGLPIEHKVVQDLGSKAQTMAPIDIRRLCHAYAEKQMAGQMTQMKRLLTLADYGDPYFTMNPKFEQGTAEVFAQMVEKGLVFRQKKPVHWSIENRTALAEAELEYQDREDTSIYVWFEFAAAGVPGLLEEFGCAAHPLAQAQAKPPALMIWTTTPWTLPANLAAAVHPSHVYALVELEGRLTVLAKERLEAVCKQRNLAVPEVLGTTEGFNLAGYQYRHPFIESCAADCAEHGASAEKVWTVVAADYVTLEDGTGIVHTAPGHGTEDYQTGLREKLPVYCPVRENGTFDDSVPAWLRGQHVWKANPMVVDRLKETGHLFHSNKFMHSYPHDWRGKTPVIFRATSQWFVAVDAAYGSEVKGLRHAALREVEDGIRFIPAWGKNRLRGMLDSRPDWCVSRQRSWGLPIPAFFNQDGEPLLTAATARVVAQAFGKFGSDAWYTQSPAQLLAGWNPQADAQAPAWAKQPGALENLRAGHDTFDVWFESGSSWNAVLCEGWRAKQAQKAHFPADLYLEGSDQHRGWFQHSLLPSVALHGTSPFKTVLTHGFMVDKNGHKMSKSDGNTINVEDLMKTQGADVCRWWVASINPENDIKADIAFFNLAGEEYRKVRNTIRFLLSVLDGFDKEKHAHAWGEADNASVDAWILKHSVALTDEVRAAYAEYRFRDISRAIFNFCNDTLSAVYLFAVKDRLYCDKVDSLRRRRTQDALWRVTENLIRLLAPICPHTADEAYAAFKGLPADNLTDSVHLLTLPKGNCCRGIAQTADAGWDRVMVLRESWTKAIEDQKKALGAENPLDLGLTVPADAQANLAAFDARDLADLVGVSRFAVGGDAIVVADLRQEPRCERSWKRDGTVKARADGGMLSDRDAAAVGV